MPGFLLFLHLTVLGTSRGVSVPSHMVLVLSKFKVANEMSDAVRRAFVDRPKMVEGAEGFLRLEVVTPKDDPDEFWLMTYWTDVESYSRWHKSDAHHQSHRGIPKGLRLDPSATEIRVFDHVCS